MTTAPAPRFGALLKHYRRAAGLTQEALAEQARLSVRGIQNLESGVSQTPRPDTVALLATALRLAAEERAELLAAARRPPRRAFPPTPSPVGPAVATVAEVLVPLVGRQRELALLAQFLAGVGERGRAAPLLLLAGEPGIGKTRLLQAVAQQAIAQGWGVLAGGCHRRGGQEPYAPMLDALAQHLQAQTPARRRAALAGCAWLVRLLPELAEVLEPLPGGTLTPEQERRLMFAAVARLLANVAGPAGTLLVLDDLQWSGPDALDLLATLVRTPPPALREQGAGMLRLVGAYRDTEVRPEDPLGLLLADLAQAGLARHHALGPLAPQEAAALLANLLGGVGAGEQAVAERVLRRAGGTPFVLVSYAQALQQGSLEAAEAVPWDVAQGVRQRVALLPQTAQELLGAAANVGRQVPRALLVALAGQPEEAMLAGLEAACRARLLREEGEEAYAFVHDVIREVVEADVGAARRALLHRRVAQALEGDPVGAPAELLAYHYARGGAPEQAAQYLELAGDHAWAQRAHGAAQSHYREVLERLEALGRTQDAVRVREKLGEVLYRSGRYEAAIEVLEPAAEALRAAGDWEGLGRVTVRLGWPHAMRGTPREGIARLTALLELLEQSGASASTQVTLYEALGELLFVAGEYGPSLATSERAAALAGAAGDDRTRVWAEWSRVNALQMLGRLGDALRLGHEVLPLTEAVGDQDNLLRAHRDLAYIHALRGAVETGRRSIERALALTEQMGDSGEISFTLALRGWLAVVRGDWPSACSDLDRAVALSRQVDQSWISAYSLLFRARLSLADGDRVAASAAVQEAIDLAEQSGDLQALRWASGVMAELDVLAGRPEAAGARLDPLLDREGLQECDVTALLPVLAWAYLEQDQMDRAAEAVGQALARARREDMRLVLVDALRVQALIAIRQQHWAEAEHSLEEGLALTRSMPYPYAEARLLHAYGCLHIQKGEPEAARERLKGALALFRRLGARTDVALAEQALSTLSRTSPSDAALQAMAALSPGHGSAAALPAGARLSRPERQAWVLDRLRAIGALSPRAYARALGVSVDTALLDLRELVGRGLVRAEGTTRDRRYVLAGDDRS